MIAIGTIGTTRLICLDNGLILRFNKRLKKWQICKGSLCFGYLLMEIDGKKYRQHRVLGHAFGIVNLYSNLQLDHIDRVRNNNSISNLRVVTNQQNMFNQGAKGYRWKDNKWYSQIKLNGKQIYLGRFNTEQEASQAYQNAKLIYHV